MLKIIFERFNHVNVSVVLSFLVLRSIPLSWDEGESRGFSQGAAEFSGYDGEFRLLLGLAQGSPIFHSSFKGELGFALESLQGKRDLI